LAIGIAEAGQGSDAALDIADRATAACPDSAALWCSKSDVLYGRGDVEQAVADAKRAMELDPNCAEVVVNCGCLLWKVGRYAEAVEVLDRALELDPSDAVCWNLIGKALNECGRYGESITSLKRALELTPQDEGECRASLHAYLAHSLLEADGDLDAAYHHAEMASSLAGDDEDIVTFANRVMTTVFEMRRGSVSTGSGAAATSSAGCCLLPILGGIVCMILLWSAGWAALCQ